MTLVASDDQLAVHRMAPISLDRLDECAALQHRVDVKYLIGLGALAELVSALTPAHHRLEIGGRSVFGYRSVYVDTADLDCLRAHRQGRRLRFKARTRSYTQTGVHRFEVKLKDGRGATRKFALAIDPDAAAPGAEPAAAGPGRTGPARAGPLEGLPPASSRFLESVLAEAKVPYPPGLTVALAVEHDRSTLVDVSGGARLTIDTGLTFSVPGPRHRAGSARMRPGRALVETKSVQGRSRADLILRSMGERPVAVSKYCAGVCLTRPWITAHPWRPLLDRHFETD